ncbi:MAG TPA: hypothetical protein VKT78_19595 [Fimbriimonadaceae bacterium]|nr:hypothetical protein [Fimbriimonadaceae bacterium]
MIALLAASLLFGGPQWGPNHGRFSDVPLSDYFHFDSAQKSDYGYLANLPLFRGGLAGVRFRERQLVAPGNVYLEPGLTLVPEDSAYQRLGVLWGYDLPPCGPSPRAVRLARELVHVACFDMDKKMPDNMRFRIEACPDPILGKLCGLDKELPIRGLYEQPRIWIYTNNATRADCNAHLQREITPSIYLRSLWEDSTVSGALDLTKPGILKCIEPNLILGINAPQRAKQWLVGALDIVNPSGLVHELQTDGPSFQGLVPDNDRAKNMAGLLDALYDSKTPGVTLALPHFIDTALPPDRKRLVLSFCTHQF